MRMVLAAEAFPALLQGLSRVREPVDALHLAMQGPLAAYGAQGAFVSAVRGDALVLLASAGLPAAFTDRYRQLPVGGEHPASEALRQLAVVGVPLGDVVREYPALGIDQALWDGVAGACGAGAHLLVIPVWLGERIGGVLGFITGQAVQPVLDDAGTLLGLGAALGMWLQVHRGAIDLVRVPDAPASGEVPLVLTARQREILALVDHGKSNPVIAATLGFSTATVKAELARIMRMLRCTDRQAAVAGAKELGLLEARPPGSAPSAGLAGQVAKLPR